MIPTAIRAELDQTPEWWAGLFHAALAKVGAECVRGDEINVMSASGKVVVYYAEIGYPDCPCRDCRRICR